MVKECDESGNSIMQIRHVTICLRVIFFFFIKNKQVIINKDIMYIHCHAEEKLYTDIYRDIEKS